MTTPSRPAAGAAPGITGRLTALADWMQQRLDDADYDRRAVTESGITQLRGLAALARDAATGSRRAPAAAQPGRGRRATAATILRAIASLIEETGPGIGLPSIRVHYIFGAHVADAAAMISQVAAALSCQWRADMDRAASSGRDWLELEAQTGADAGAGGHRDDQRQDRGAVRGARHQDRHHHRHRVGTATGHRRAGQPGAAGRCPVSRARLITAISLALFLRWLAVGHVALTVAGASITVPALMVLAVTVITVTPSAAALAVYQIRAAAAVAHGPEPGAPA